MNIKRVLWASASVLGMLVTLLLLFLAIDFSNVRASSTIAAHVIGQEQALAQVTTPQAEPTVERAPWDVTPVPEESVQSASVGSDEIPPLSVGTALSAEEYSQLIKPSSPTKTQSAQGAGADAPIITIWYGDVQRFGHLGKPLKWANILGNISGPNPIITLTYSLNGDVAQPLSMGPDKRRLARLGDFNVEIDYASLVVGDNTVVITGTDSLANQTTHTVTVNYTAGVTWSTSTQVNWGTATTIQDRAQVVDGKWALQGSNVRPLELAYDRMIAIGDVTWDDYEVVVPVTVHSIDPEGFKSPSNGPGVGLLLRWQGHYNEAGEQPNTGWKELGALGWFRWSKDINDSAIGGLQMIGFNGGIITNNPNKQASAGVTYMIKMSVQSIGNTPYYRFKVWESSEPEPLIWDMQGSGNKNGPTNGSLLLVAHHVDASFGQVTVQPLSSITPQLQVFTTGNGSVTISPDSPYAYGEKVKLTAVGQTGNRLASWSGDASGNTTTLEFDITSDTVITANFVVATEPPKITVAKPEHGVLVVSPAKQAYLYGETISFTAVPEPGYMLSSWIGDLAGKANPLKVTIEGDIVANASFVAAQAPFSDDFNRCTLNTDIWTFRDPVGDVTYSTPGKRLQISIPSGTNHDLWTGKNFAPRLMQPANNVDFTVETKFESALTTQYQMQGIIVEQDTDNFLRFEFYHDGNDLHVYAASILGGLGSARINQIVVPTGTDMYLRIERSGNQWTESYSFDGSTWNVSGTFTQALSVTAAGIHAGNAGALPAHTAIVDYFFNSAAPIAPEDAKEFTLQTNKIGQGQITVDPDNAIYGCGDQITFSATPAEGWVFAEWSGALASTDTSATLTFDMGAVVTGTFTEGQEPQYTLKVNAVNGTVTVSPEKETYLAGEKVTLTATPDNGFQFSGWSGDLTGMTSPVEFTITKSSVITALFEPEPNATFTLTVNAANGTVAVSPQKATYQPGETVTITATPNSGFQFTGWSGDLTGNASPTQFTITKNSVITAAFAPISVESFTLTVNAVNGTVAVSPPKATYLAGEKVTLTATPNSGFQFSGWSGDLTGTASPAEFTITKNSTITAGFVPTTTNNILLFLPIVANGQ